MKSNNKEKMSMQEMLIENRTIFLTSAITSDLLSSMMATLFYLDAVSDEPIHMYISSPGGQVDAGLGIIDVMNEIRSPVYTYAIGTVASMASIIFLYGDQRVMLPNAEIMIHQPLGGVQGQASDIVITANRILETKNKLTHMVCDRTGLTEKRVSNMMDRDTWLNLEKARLYGFLTKSDVVEDQNVA
jgi:ATP-dependent Clp protease protease subunit